MAAGFMTVAVAVAIQEINNAQGRDLLKQVQPIIGQRNNGL
jgi:hypothetical protein